MGDTVTIKDVSRRAGVSIASVSAVVNGRTTTSTALRRRVLAAIEELGYRPNGVARSLRTRRTQAIGLLVSDITNPFFPDIARGVEDEARRNGFHVILCNTDEDLAIEEAQVKLLAEKRVDGIIATAVRVDSRITALASGTPVVLVNRHLPGLDTDFVGIDNTLAAREAVEHLIALGHTRIGFVPGAERSTASEDRYTGYCQALEAAGIGVSSALVARGHLKYKGGYEAGRYFVGLAPRPSAIFAADDLMAFGVLEALLQSGVRVPEDVALMGFDDIWVAAQPSILLSTVRQPRHEMGVMAVRLLIKRLRDRSKKPQTVILPHELVIRRSCGAMLRGGSDVAPLP